MGLRSARAGSRLMAARVWANLDWPGIRQRNEFILAKRQARQLNAAGIVAPQPCCWRPSSRLAVRLPELTGEAPYGRTE